jgi:hypothetical protein
MKQIMLILLCISCSCIAHGQKSGSFLEKTTWKMKDVVLTGEASGVDSIGQLETYKKFYDARFCFKTKNKLSIAWGKYCSNGIYQELMTRQGRSFRITLKRLSLYDYGHMDRIEFGNFLYAVSYSSCHFLDDYSFVMIVDDIGFESKVFFEKVH